jgi:hypothetical protein
VTVRRKEKKPDELHIKAANFDAFMRKAFSATAEAHPAEEAHAAHNRDEVSWPTLVSWFGKLARYTAESPLPGGDGGRCCEAHSAMA